MLNLIVSKFSEFYRDIALESCQHKMLPFIAHLTGYKFNYLLTVIMSTKFITSLKTLFLRNYEDRTFNLGVLENMLGPQTYVPMAAYDPRVAITALHEKLKAFLAKRKHNSLNINLSEKCRQHILAQKKETYITCSVHCFPCCGSLDN